MKEQEKWHYKCFIFVACGIFGNIAIDNINAVILNIKIG